jgi:putative transposase
MLFHALNRANARAEIFLKAADYARFEEVLAEAAERSKMRILSYCLMPNHWHLVLWPRKDGDLSRFMGWLTLTHTQRWHAHYQSAGTGHLFQGRFKSFPIQSDDHFLTVCRYVERNPVRAKLCSQAEEWRWSSLYHRQQKDDFATSVLGDWPVPRPRQWLSHLQKPQTDEELEAVRRSVRRGAPFGSDAWTLRTAKQLELETTLRPRGRPRKSAMNGS